MISFNKKLIQICNQKNNRLCIGLDIDNRKLKNQSISYMDGFIQDIIESTIKICPIYKINFAFYERLGYEGFKLLNKITEYINGRSITIADAKRGDIGNSSKYYAETVFNTLNYDSITVSPYMGRDSISPFYEFKDKGVFILCLTSNEGSKDFQIKKIDEEELYIKVARFALSLNTNDNIGLVVGATKNDRMKRLKKYSQGIPWLIPGIGFQGGSLEDSIKIESSSNSLSIINVSRDIIYSGSIEDIKSACENYTSKIRNIL